MEFKYYLKVIITLKMLEFGILMKKMNKKIMTGVGLNGRLFWNDNYVFF